IHRERRDSDVERDFPLRHGELAADRRQRDLTVEADGNVDGGSLLVPVLALQPAEIARDRIPEHPVSTLSACANHVNRGHGERSAERSDIRTEIDHVDVCLELEIRLDWRGGVVTGHGSVAQEPDRRETILEIEMRAIETRNIASLVEGLSNGEGTGEDALEQRFADREL